MNNNKRFENIDKVISELTDSMNGKNSITKLYNMIGPLIEICRDQEYQIRALKEVSKNQIDRIVEDIKKEDEIKWMDKNNN